MGIDCETRQETARGNRSAEKGGGGQRSRGCESRKSSLRMGGTRTGVGRSVSGGKNRINYFVKFHNKI